jgi:hypothetical protein
MNCESFATIYNYLLTGFWYDKSSDTLELCLSCHDFPKAIRLVGKGIISIQDVHPRRYLPIGVFAQRS